jgi:hypothetical protein
MSKFEKGDRVFYDGSEQGIIIDVNSDEGDIDYNVRLLDSDYIINNIDSNKLQLVTQPRFEQLKQKKENGTLSPDELKEYLQFSLDNSKKQYELEMAKIDRKNSIVDNIDGGKRKTRKTRKTKKRKTRKGKKGKKVRKSRK